MFAIAIRIEPEHAPDTSHLEPADLARYNNDEFHFVGVCVVIERAEVGFKITVESDYLWGVQTDDEAYIRQVARELFDEIPKEALAGFSDSPEELAEGLGDCSIETHC